MKQGFRFLFVLLIVQKILLQSVSAQPSTYLVRDARRGSMGSNALLLNSSSAVVSTPVGASLVYSAADSANGSQPWVSNGATAATVMLRNLSPLSGTTGSSPENFTTFTPMGSTTPEVFFTADNGTGPALFRTNGTTAGTVFVRNVLAASGFGAPLSQLTVAGNTLFFLVQVADNNLQLWKSDGTTAGTAFIQRATTTTGSFVREMTSVGNSLFFVLATRQLNGSFSYQLWRSDGTAAGTVAIGQTLTTFMDKLTSNGTFLFFRCTITQPNNTTRYALARTDGTTAGTILLRQFSNTASSVGNLTNLNGTLFFAGRDFASNPLSLWSSDGSAGGTTLRIAFADVSDIVRAGSELYIAATGSRGASSIWRWTGNGAQEMFLFPAMGIDPSWLTPVGNTLYCFGTATPSFQTGLLRIDGSRIQVIRVFQPGQTLGYTASAGNTFFFGMNDGVTGVELWASSYTPNAPLVTETQTIRQLQTAGTIRLDSTRLALTSIAQAGLSGGALTSMLINSPFNPPSLPFSGISARSADNAIIVPSAIVQTRSWFLTNVSNMLTNYRYRVSLDASGLPATVDLNRTLILRSSPPATVWTPVNTTRSGSTLSSSDTLTLAEETRFAFATGSVASVEKISDTRPTRFELQQNYPNPFNPSTEIRYQVSGTSDVRLEVFDVLGRKVSTLVNERQAAGSYRVNFNAANLSSGTYFYRIEARSSGSQAGSFVETKKMLLVK
jgi:ELWxxDGT repeat protein